MLLMLHKSADVSLYHYHMQATISLAVHLRQTDVNCEQFERLLKKFHFCPAVENALHCELLNCGF